MKKDCFDSCPITNCLAYGKDIVPPDFCAVDPIVDRYEPSKRKRPCSTCAHQADLSRCRRCVHG